MTKHPNAPAEDRTKRKKQVPISLEEYDEIHRLWESGMTKRQISDATGRSTGTVTHTIVKLTRESVERRMKHPNAKNERDKYACHELVEEDLSQLPDKILFEYSKEYIL